MSAEKTKISKRSIAIIICVAALLTVAVGTTVAYLMDKTSPISNTFNPVSVDCEINETFDASTNTKTNVSVRNTGDVSAYIRATVVINWVSNNGSVYGGAPVEGTDYTLTLAESDWIKGADGSYYYPSAIEAGKSTEMLISSVSPIADKAPDGYTLSVEIHASAIQSEPAEAVSSAWGNVSVGTDGTLSYNNE